MHWRIYNYYYHFSIAFFAIDVCTVALFTYWCFYRCLFYHWPFYLNSNTGNRTLMQTIHSDILQISNSMEVVLQWLTPKDMKNGQTTTGQSERSFIWYKIKKKKNANVQVLKNIQTISLSNGKHEECRLGVILYILTLQLLPLSLWVATIKKTHYFIRFRSFLAISKNLSTTNQRIARLLPDPWTAAKSAK